MTVCRVAVLLLSALLLLSTPAFAQGDPAAASAAFSRGQALQISGDHGLAAEAFELAYRILPTPAALRAAIVNRMAAGHSARAATLALDALGRYPEDQETRTLATTTLNDLAPRLTRVTVRCAEPCTVAVSGQLVITEAAAESSFYLVPGAQNLDIRFDSERAVSHRIETREGDAIERVFSPPPPPEAPKVAQTTPSVPPVSTPAPKAEPVPAPVAAQVDAPERAERDGLAPAYFYTGLGLTAAAVGVSVWSGLDTLSGVDAYEDMPTKARYDAGRDKEVRTDILIGVSAALGVGTAVLGLFFTDFGRSRDERAEAPRRTRAAATLSSDGAHANLSMRF